MGPTATPKEAAQLFAGLLNSYPTEVLRLRNAGVDLAEVGKAYAEEFQRYPAGWALEAFRRLRRESSQLPTIADVCAMIRVVGGWTNG
jgi:hypothetical protein